MPLTISTPYKTNTVASVSGTTFNSNGTPFAVGGGVIWAPDADGSATMTPQD